MRKAAYSRPARRASRLRKPAHQPICHQYQRARGTVFRMIGCSHHARPITPSEIVAIADDLGASGGGAGPARLVALLFDDSVDSAEIVRCLQAEPTLAARVLKVANSAYYRRGGNVGTFEQALVVLGLAGVRGIAAVGCMERIRVPTVGKVLDAQRFRCHSIAVAAAAQSLSATRPRRCRRRSLHGRPNPRHWSRHPGTPSTAGHGNLECVGARRNRHLASRDRSGWESTRPLPRRYSQRPGTCPTGCVAPFAPIPPPRRVDASPGRRRCLRSWRWPTAAQMRLDTVYGPRTAALLTPHGLPASVCWMRPAARWWRNCPTRLSA